jgi:5-methylcytosine-specific restriction enzyme A
MSTNRVAPDRGFREAKRDETGKRLCRRCSRPVGKGRRNWCSEECIHEHKLRSDPEYLRRQVWKRDHGICALCGFNAGAIALKLLALRKDSWRSGFAELDLYRAELRSQGIDSSQALWHADHIVPVSEGGGECGLENIRTLCVPCHKTRTAEQAKQRAKRRAVERARQIPDDL